MTRRLLMAGIVAGLALPASADAASLAVDRPCYPVNGPINVSGTGFTPNTQVQLSFSNGTSAGFATADAAGNFGGAIQAPSINPLEQALTLIGTDRANPANTGSAALRITRFQASTKPSRARPHKRVLYRVRGFTGGGTVYVHYVFRGKLRGTRTLGPAKPPCGVVNKRMPLLPLRKVRFGTWTLQIDTSRKYSKNTLPRLVGTLLIFRTVRPRGATAALFAEQRLEWSQPGSNRRPLACKASALPTELWPLAAQC
jgi:hypothetical protein